MKKLFWILILLMLLLVSCGENEPDSGPAVKVDDEGNVILEDRDILPEGGEWNENWPESKYKPLVSATSYGGTYSSGFLYYIENSHILYVDFNTNETNVCCFDPLCDHGYPGEFGVGGINADTDCKAFCPGTSNILARIENGNTVLYYDSSFFDTQMTEDGELIHYNGLLRYDIENNEITDVAKFYDYSIETFWFYGDDLILSLAYMEDRSKDGVYLWDGKELRLLMSNGADNAWLLGTDERGLLWQQGNEIFLSSPDFSVTVSLMKDYEGRAAYYYDGYIYIAKSKESTVTVKYEPYEGEYEESYSRGGNTGEYIPKAYDWYRIRTETGAKEELILENTTFEKNGGSLSYLDAENGMFYYLPLDPLHMGFILFVNENGIGDFGYNGETILSRHWKDSGGRVCVLDLKTLETKDVYSGLDGDVLTVYGIVDGSLAVKYRIEEIDKIKELMKTDPLTGSTIDYNVYTFLPMLND